MSDTLTSHLLSAARAYADNRRLALSTVGKIAAGDGRFFLRLEDAGSTMTARKYDSVMSWFSGNWPEGVAWPRGVPRPAVPESAA